jgi:putative PIN family toxin of toxin-antitoxin system
VRITLDSSVLIAAYVTRAGACAELLEEVLQHHELVLSDYMLDEVRRKLTYKLLLPPRLVARVVQSLAKAASMVEPTQLPPDACRDPTDLPILGTAVAGDAELLVSVDNDLLVLKRYVTIDIVRPGEFWSRAAR